MAALRSYEPPQASRVFDGQGALVAHLSPERRIVIPLQGMPAHLIGGFLAVEDRRFFDHHGVDYRRVVGSLIRDLQVMRFDQGFSTITMQLARNVFPEYLSREKTLKRKFREVLLALQMEREFTKSEILEMYLNQIYLGEGYYGVEAAAQGYFGKSVRALNVGEAAMLAAIPKGPTSYNPRDNPVAAVRRRNLVLGMMFRSSVITESEQESAAEQPLRIIPPVQSTSDAPYFLAAIRREVRERFGDGAETAGLRIFTALDRSLQSSAVTQLNRQLAAVEKGEMGRFRGPACSSGPVANPGECLQGMFVAIDNQTGDVLALVGGRDFALSQFDRATQAQRQAGSAFKPFLFATALAAGIPITTTLLGPGAIDSESGYMPADHVSDSVSVDLREALRLSSNRAAVVLGERVGVSSVVRTARSMGINTPLHEYPSTLLGASEVVPIEMVGAYTAFANYGAVVKPRLIQRVEDADGKVIWEQSVQRNQVISAQAAFLTNDLMRDVVDRGTGSSVRAAGLPWKIPAAGKTGTTNDAADAWFVGSTPDITAGVWVGFDRRQRITVGGGGGSIAAPVWGRVMASYYKTHAEPQPWRPPYDLIQIRIDRETGFLATSECPESQVVQEWFIPGTEPRGYCPLHVEHEFEGWFRRGIRGVEEIFRRRGSD
jgi:penicillin-binding protein 1A